MGDIELREFVRQSEVIAVGKVERVYEVGRDPPELPEVPGPLAGSWHCSATEVPLAKVTVQRSHKGARDGETVYFLAASTWTCDITDAVAGETALFFLDSPAWVEQEPGGFRSELAMYTGGAPVWRVAHAGRGRMPLRTVEEAEHATYWDEVILPRDLPVIAGPEPENEFIRSARLEELEKRVGEMVAAQLPYLRATSRLPLSPDAGWDLRVWGDGRGLLQIDYPLVRRRELRFEAERMARLGEVLTRACASELPRTLGSPGIDGPRRELEIRTRDIALDLEILTLSHEPPQGEEPRRQAARALDLWAEVRGLFEEPQTIDHRPYDRAWIEAWR